MASRLSYPLLVIGVGLAGFMYGLSFQLREDARLSAERFGRPFVEMEAALPASFEAKDGVLRIDGGLDQTSHPRFLAALEGAEIPVRSVEIASPGGSLDAALAIGRDVRRLGLATRVPDRGLCASSCPLVLAAGIQRTIGDGARIGVHQIRLDELVLSVPPDGMSDGQFGVMAGQMSLGVVVTYLRDMGVSPDFWLLGLQTPADRLRLLDGDDIARLETR